MEKDQQEMQMIKKYAAEFIGTFALILAGAGSIIMSVQMGGGAGLLGIALAHGIAIAVMVSALGAVSGGHFNPAVTFGLLMSKKIKMNHAFGYMAAQLLGATIAALMLTTFFFPDSWQAAQLGTPMLANGISLMRGIVIEAVLTFFLMLAVFGTAVDRRAPNMGGLFIGLSITMDILFAGPLTGAAMNPARTFGPALAGWIGNASYNPWAGHLVYWIGPMLGAALASVVYNKVVKE